MYPSSPLEDLGLEPCSVWSQTWARAKKGYTCDCCQAHRIAPGERYMRHFSVFDGNPCSERVCEACAVVFLDVFHQAFKASPTPSYFHELLREEAHEQRLDDRIPNITRNLYAAFLRHKRRESR